MASELVIAPVLAQGIRAPAHLCSTNLPGRSGELRADREVDRVEPAGNGAFAVPQGGTLP